MPKYRPPTPEQQEEFLALIANGKTRQEAAEEVGATATAFRTLANGGSPDSVAFAERYLAVLEEIGRAPTPIVKRIKELEGVQLAHRLLDETIMRALDGERGKVGASNRVLYNLSLLTLESFKPLLEARVRHVHSGSVGLYAALPKIDTSKWTIEQQEEFIQLEARRSELLALATLEGQVATSRPELEAPGVPEEVVEDAEFSEVASAG